MKYVWLDKKTGIEITVDRSMKDFKVKPSRIEAAQQGMEVEDYKEADWERLVTGGSTTIGFGMKGNWTWIIGGLTWLL